MVALVSTIQLLLFNFQKNPLVTLKITLTLVLTCLTQYKSEQRVQTVIPIPVLLPAILQQLVAMWIVVLHLKRMKMMLLDVFFPSWVPAEARVLHQRHHRYPNVILSQIPFTKTKGNVSCHI